MNVEKKRDQDYGSLQNVRVSTNGGKAEGIVVDSDYCYMCDAITK